MSNTKSQKKPETHRAIRGRGTHGISDLEKLKDKASTRSKASSGKGGKRNGYRLQVCVGGGCIASGALAVIDRLKKELSRRKSTSGIQIVKCGCLGPCALGPVVVVHPEGVLYRQVTPDDVPCIVSEHLVQGRVVERLLPRKPVGPGRVQSITDFDFLAKQTKVVLRNCGIIDPESIEDSLARDGYAAAAKVFNSLTPGETIEILKKSGLRGRGGAGFPTWLKWSLTKKSEEPEKFVLCNADEGDPGAFMDRSVLEGDPHSLIEAMLIAARTVGASRGFVYVRAEYPLAVRRLQKAIRDAYRRNLLGADVLSTGFSFDLDIRMGSGAFVCGEETALMASIEGKRGEPRPRPPFPADKGLWGKPSLLNNVETYAAIPAIILKGADWYAAMGTAESKGTKVFALAGSVSTTGLVEVPVGTPLGDIVYDIGGGIAGGRDFKAAQIGGPSGGCIPKEHLNVPVDYESLAELGAIMGSGGLIVMDDKTCMVDVARYFLDFVQEESCGKCVPGRVGTRRMLEILERICQGHGQMEDINRLIDLGNQIKDTALCGLGQTAPNPVLSTIKHFREEYVAHIRDGKCPAGVCPALVDAPCRNACPAGVDVPGFVSLVSEKRYSDALRVHRHRNPLAAVCASVCYHPCENFCRRADLDAPVAIRAVKRFMVEQEDAPEFLDIRQNETNAKRKIAIIGAGPAGLSCAFFLARLGYRPEIMDAGPVAGGMLAQTIPAYRLPREALIKEVRMIESMGVQIRTGMTLGRDFSLQELRRTGYQAVALALGAPLGLPLGLAGESDDGVMDGIAFLRQYSMGGPALPARSVLVIGGGNVAVDTARTAVRLGAQRVTILYRRTREQMPAYEDETRAAEKEGVRLEFLVAPFEIAQNRKGVRVLRCNRMQLGPFDRTGRRRPLASEDPPCEFAADLVVGAIGQQPDLKTIEGIGLGLVDGRWIRVDPQTAQTTVEWIFGAGDAVTGPASVVEAIAGGERAAVGIDRFLTGEEHAFWRKPLIVNTAFDPGADPSPHTRTRVRTIPMSRRKTGFEEVEQPLVERAALREAGRCLHCDYREPQEEEVPLTTRRFEEAIA